MSATVSARDLRAVCSRIVAARRHPSPVPLCALVEFAGAVCTITTTDRERTMVEHIPATEGEAGIAVVNAERLKVAAKAAQEVCQLRVDGGALFVGEVRLPAEMDASAFPVLGIPEGDRSTLTPSDFDALAWVGLAAAREDSRYAINGVLVDGARFAATDGRRLHIADRAEKATAPPEIVPLFSLAIAAKAFGKVGCALSIAKADAVFFGPTREGHATLVSQLLDRRFPDYMGVVPKAGEGGTVTLGELNGQDRVLRAATADAKARKVKGADEPPRMVYIEAPAELVLVRAECGPVETMADKAPGFPERMAFNPDFVRDAWRGPCRFQGIDDETPAVFRGEGWTAALMPISNA
jgi:DNA polymerase III sliding clamp (beta) subunit (PCNA family)